MADAAATPSAPLGFGGNLRLAAGRRDIMFAVGVICILVVLILPLPPVLLDLMLAISLTASVLVLMTVLFVEKPLQLSSFPTILLIVTMLRLALNIASTRLILSHGHEGTDAAGKVIEAFGHFVMGGDVVIGIIIFGILTIINFVVITKGSGRIAEVSARFSLDAMPGKQMAVDADLSAGLIDEATAKARRKELEDESNFYGSMDGASKFVRGDAIAGLLITFINFIAGIIIGVVNRDLSFEEAVHTYTMLTIGDGLVAQIPALIVSTASGILVTKSGVAGSAEKAVLSQLGRSPTAVAITSGFLLLMAALPGIPMAPFVLLSSATGYLAYHIIKTNKKTASDAAAAAAPMKKLENGQTVGPDGKVTDEQPADFLHIDQLRLELGYGLLPLINYQKGHRLTEQIKALRRQMARELGFVIPSVRIQDNMQLPPNTYVLKVKEIEAARGDIRPDMLLVMNPSGAKITLPGEETVEPTFGLPAMWIGEAHREEALFRNYTVVDPPTVITTHLTEIIKDNMPELLSYGETQKLLDDLGTTQQKLITETIPEQITVSGVQRVLQNLLREMVSIRDLATIVEAIAEGSRNSQNVAVISEHVRMRLARQISFSNANEAGYIPIIAMSAGWEQTFIEAITGTADAGGLSLAPSRIQEFISAVRTVYDKMAMQGEVPVLLTSPAIRPYVRSIIERFRPSTVVMSQNEIYPKARIKTLGQL
ncbi:MAG: flagellar biosynthesis protein FlhA [Alphaproteobacteria bacterium]|nr:flagellar biosynthesis protein FlhA [Alphaproteobacteria bacterium]